MAARKIAIFGSNSTGPDDYFYDLFVSIGRELARRKVTVLTGGYQGIMEAVARGVHDENGHVVGYVLGDLISRKPNGYLTRIVDCHAQAKRLKESGYCSVTDDRSSLAFHLRRHQLFSADGFICAPPHTMGTHEELCGVLNFNAFIWADRAKPMSVVQKLPNGEELGTFRDIGNTVLNALSSPHICIMSPSPGMDVESFVCETVDWVLKVH